MPLPDYAVVGVEGSKVGGRRPLKVGGLIVVGIIVECVGIQCPFLIMLEKK